MAGGAASPKGGGQASLLRCSSLYTRFSSELEFTPEMTWRDRLRSFLFSKGLHVFMCVLLVLDLVLVIASLELQILSDQAELAEWKKCDAQFDAGLAVPRGLRGPMNNPQNLPVCEPDLHYAHLLHHVEIALAWFSVGILCLMLLENALLFLCLGMEFLCDVFYMLDTFVVSVSLAFEIAALSGFLANNALGGLLIIGRTWRFARVAHGFYFLEHVEEKSRSHSSSNISSMDISERSKHRFGSSADLPRASSPKQV